MFTLYEMTAEYKAAFKELNELYEKGDILEDAVKDTLDGLKGAIEDKIANVIAYSKSVEAESEAIKKEANKMLERAKALINRADSLKTYALKHMQENEIETIKHTWFRIYIQESTKTDIYDFSQLPAGYIRETVTAEANKAAILRDLKEKHNIPGARLLHEKYLKVN
jgi:phage shock protein A